METEMVLRFAAIVIAGLILLSGFDYGAIVTYVKSFVKQKSPTVVVNTQKDTSFLEIVETWHNLRNQCEAYGLKEAINKIDEVFPLLNTEG